jgi:hypothetical protein
MKEPTLTPREVSVTMNVHDADPLPNPLYSKRRFRPDSLTVTYIRGKDGKWTFDASGCRYIALSGPVLRRDGSESDVQRYDAQWANPDPPAWAVEFAYANLPKTDPINTGRQQAKKPNEEPTA